jgi:hypothetical protein
MVQEASVVVVSVALVFVVVVVVSVALVLVFVVVVHLSTLRTRVCDILCRQLYGRRVLCKSEFPTGARIPEVCLVIESSSFPMVT